MNSSYRGLAFGLLFAVLLVYFLMVVNFQSWLDPFVILMALPGALSGIEHVLPRNRLLSHRYPVRGPTSPMLGLRP